MGSGINFVSIAGILKKEHTCLFVQKHKISYLWACTVTAIDHREFCHLKPVTDTQNLSSSLLSPSDFSEVIGEKHSSELPVAVH